MREWINRKLTNFLNQRIGGYERLYANDSDLMKRHIRTGDVVLVEGDQRISAIIKHLTGSSWSHAALYIGDELVRRGGAMRELALENFGDEAEHLIVEALMEGVVVSPLVKYSDLHVRLCRPHRLRGEHLRKVLDAAVSAIGWRYDMRNILDLARHLIAAVVIPRRYRTEAMRFGSGASTAVICTSLIGRLFHDVGFPVLPMVEPEIEGHLEEPSRPSRWALFRRNRRRYSGVYRRIDPTVLTPRDFDFSPYFEIVKFNIIKQRGFDYGRIEWADGETNEAHALRAVPTESDEVPVPVRRETAEGRDRTGS